MRDACLQWRCCLIYLWCLCRGDQGFLNSYFYGFSDAPMFDARRDYTGAGISVMRLPTVYNADLGLYVINGNRWTLQPDEIR